MIGNTKSKLHNSFMAFIGHAKKHGATKEELDILCKASELIKKYSPIKPR